MSGSDDWTRVAELLDGALAQPDELRSRYLDEQIDDPELRERVGELLASHEEAPDFLEAGAPSPFEISPGDELGPYRVVREIAEGGMGAVYEGERIDGSYDRSVALKVIKPGMDTRAVLRRFEAERRILARLEHPSIARLYEAGATEIGRPWLALELVDGEPITEFAQAQELTLRERLTLLIQVCDAVEHAHRNLVVHRDLKPSNVLVRPDASVALLDFGVAKLLEDGNEGLTRTQDRLMTRPYAAPEQILGQPITTATDVHALGILLFELLARERPFQADTATALETAILESLPTLPRDLPPELGLICAKALSKAPQERYSSARALAQDLERWLAGLPIEARPPSTVYVLRKFVARHRAGVAAGVAALLLTGFFAALYAWRITEERNTARFEAEKAQRVAEFMGGLFRDADPALTGGKAVSARQVLDRAAERLRSDRQTAPETKAQLHQALGEVYTSLAVYDEAETLLSEADTLRLEHLSSSHPDRGAGLLAQSSLALAKGQLREAHRLAREGEEIQRLRFGAQDPRTARAQRSLGLCEKSLANFDSAESLLRQALRTLTAEYGGNHPDVATTQTALAETLNRLDRVEDAEELYRAALETRRLQFGDTHPGVASSLAHLGDLLISAGRFEDAARYFRESLDLNRLLHGEDHPNVADALARFGSLAMHRGSFDEADEYYFSAVETSRRAFGEDNHHVARQIAARAGNMIRHARYDEGLTLLDEALAILRQSVGDAHPVTAQVLGDRAYTISYLGDLEGAAAAYREVLEAEQAVFGKEHSAYATTLASLGTVLFDLSDPEAVPITKRALEIRRQVLPPDHPATANSLYSLGTQHLYGEELEKAEPLISECAAMRRRLFGAADWRTIQADARDGLIRSRLGRSGAGDTLLDAQDRARVELADNAGLAWLRQQIDDAVTEHLERDEGTEP
ncbi:MAG: serine/threonine-protein kinase [Acidobacteriota bacterium]